MTPFTELETTVAAADQRLRVRAMTLRADWQQVQTACRSALTSPAIIGSVAVVGALIGARSRSPAERKRIETPSSFSRMLLLAVVTPLLQKAIASSLAHLVAREDAPCASDTASSPR